MPRALQKLTRNGNSTGVSIPRTILHHVGWLPGESIIVEVLEDNSVRLRRPVERDFGPTAPPRLLHDPIATESK